MFKKIKWLVSFLRPRVGPKTWVFTLLKDNLGQKIGTAWALWPVISIILTAMVTAMGSETAGRVPAVDVTTKMALDLSEMSKVVNSKWLLGGLVLSSVLWAATIAVRAAYAYMSMKWPWLFKFSKLGWLFSAVTQGLLGAVLVPMVINWALIAIIPALRRPGMLVDAISLTAMYVVVTAMLHYLASIDNQKPNSIIYVIDMSNAPGVRAVSILDSIDGAHTGLEWIGNPEIVSESQDGMVVVTLPILFIAKKWRRDASKQLASMLKNAEQEWVDQGCKIITREAPKKLRRDLKNPISARKPEPLPTA